MGKAKVLVVFYSRSSHTRQVGRAIADAGAWDVEEIREPHERTGLRGYLRSALEAATGRATAILPLDRRVADYDLVVVGTPVWSASLSSPVRAFLMGHRGELRDVAFFLTHGGSGAHHVFRQMEAVALRAPVTTLAVTEAALARDQHDDRVRGLVSAVTHWLEERPPRPARAQAEAFPLREPVAHAP